MISTFSLFCVCPSSAQQCQAYAESAEEDGALCLHPFCWVFPVLWIFDLNIRDIQTRWSRETQLGGVSRVSPLELR